MRWGDCIGGALALVVFAFPAAASASTDNTFKTVCAPIAAEPQQMDPIVYPGQFPAGHLHEFFGNTQINPSSTGDQLLADGAALHTSCADRFDTAAYWVPTLYRDGERLAPRGMDAYYQRMQGLSPVIVPPTDFRLIAGNHDATAPLPQSQIAWHCMGQSGTMAPTPPTCSGQLGLDIRFPNCWDGLPPHQANNTDFAVYASPCPPGYVSIPKVLLTVHYPGSLSRHRYTLSEDVGGVLDNLGSIYGAHADFLNGWTSLTPADPLDFSSLIAAFDNGPDHTPGCDEICTRTAPTGDAFHPIYP